MSRMVLFAASAVLAVAFPATAATFFVDDQAGFAAAAGPTAFESFENAFEPDMFTVAFGGGIVSCNQGKFCGPTKGFENGLSTTTPASGMRSVEFKSGALTRVIFAFDAPITAFGVLIGGAGSVQNVSLDFETSNGDRRRMISNYGNGEVPNSFADNTIFGGVVDPTGFDRLIVTTPQSSGDGIFLDDLQTALLAPIPLPAALPLLLAGLGVLAVLRRRQRAA